MAVTKDEVYTKVQAALVDALGVDEEEVEGLASLLGQPPQGVRRQPEPKLDALRQSGCFEAGARHFGVMGVGFLGMVAGVWFGGRRALFAARQNLRRIIREELDSQNRH